MRFTMPWKWVDADVGEWGGTLHLLGTPIHADVLSCDDVTILLWEWDEEIMQVVNAAQA